VRSGRIDQAPRTFPRWGLTYLGWSFWTWRTLRARHAARELPAGANVLAVAFRQLSETMETPARTVATPREPGAGTLSLTGSAPRVQLVVAVPAGALAVTRAGAQDAMPGGAETLALAGLGTDI
jgi:hypothetical protein